MLGPPKLRAADRLVTVSLEERVPANHFYRHLDATLDLTFVREWVQDLYAERGRPSIDPVVFFKLQLIMFFEGLRSERRLIETASLHLAHRWYLGYGLDEPLPDHSSLTRIRQRLGLPIFERFFEHVVERCQQAGLVWGKELFYQQAQTHVAELFAADTDAALPESAASIPAPGPESAEGDTPARPGPIRLPTGVSPEQEGQFAAENRGGWKLLEHRRLDPERPPRNGYQRLTGLRVSTTDPDAALMRLRGEGMALGYHDHYVVDGGKRRIILAALVTPADVMENTPMLDLLWRVRFRWKLRPRRAVGDTTYGTVENIRALEEGGIRAYVPLPDWDQRTPYYGSSRFTYDPVADEYRCPQDHPLRRQRAKFTEEVVVYQAETATCNACPVRAACTASEHGRQIYRSFYAEHLDRVRGYHATEAYAKAMRKRAVWVEPLFGEAKQWHGLRQFRLRGLENVNMQALLVAAGQNLKRWLAARGWGRRHGPQGSLLALPHPAAPLSFFGLGATPAR